MQKLQEAIDRAEMALKVEDIPLRLKIRIEVIFEKMEREHPFGEYKRWEAQFYTKVLNEATSQIVGGEEVVSRIVLQEAIDWAVKYKGESSIDRERAYGELILLKAGATQEEIDGAADRIVTAIRKHEKIQMTKDIKKELESLEEVILIAENYKDHQGIKISLEIAVNVRDRGQSGEISEELLEEIKGAKDALIQALSQALAPAQKTDKEALENAIAKATDRQTKGNNGTLRIPNVLKEHLKEAIEEGQETLKDKRALKYDYTLATEQLLHLVAIIDDLPNPKTIHELEELVAKAEALLEGDPLSFISKAKIHAALGVANYTMADYLAKDEDYIQAIHQLKEAIAGAEPADPNTPGSEEDVEELKRAVEDAKKMQEREGLSHEDHRILQEEIDKAEELLKQEKPKKIDVQRATEAVRAAIANAMPVKAPEPTQKQKDQLRELVNEAKKALEREGISFEDVRTLNGAIENGTQILSKKDATRDDYDKAIERLRDALNKTKPINPIGPKPDEEPADAVDRGLLNQAMEKLMAEKNKVIKDDRDRIDGAVRDARFVRDDDYATKQDIQDQIEYLNKMKEGLTYLATEEQLKKLHELVRKANLQINRLSPEESQELRDETNIAEIFLEAKGEKTATDAEERYKKLDAAFRKTVKNATDEHKKELQDKLNELAKDKELLSPEDQKELQDVLDRGKEVATDDLATDIEVEDMLDELKEWEEKTQLATSKKKLKEMLNQAEEKLEKNKDLNTKQLQDAVQAGNKVYANKEANQATVDRAIEDLKEAMTEFEEQIQEKQEADREKEELRVQIEHAQRELEKGVSKASEKKLQDAITHGNQVNQDATIPAAAVQDAIQDLKDAIQAVEYLANDTLKRALHDKIQEARRFATEEHYTERQKNELTALANEAQRVYESEELLESQANKEITKLDEMIKQLIELASVYDYTQLKKAKDSLEVIGSLFEDDAYEAKKLSEILKDATELLNTQELPDKAPKKEVQEKTKEMQTLLEQYRDVEEKRWKEEKGRLKGYIEYMDYMISGEEWKPEGSTTKLPIFVWQNTEDKAKIRGLSEESKQLKDKATDMTKVSLKELMDHNAKLRIAIETVDKMTEEDWNALKEKVISAEALLLDDINNEELFNKLYKVIEKSNSHLNKVVENEEPFSWPGMNRFLFLDLMNELEELSLKVQSSK